VVAKFLEKQAALAAAAERSSNGSCTGKQAGRPAPLSGSAHSFAAGSPTDGRNDNVRDVTAAAADHAAAAGSADTPAAEPAHAGAAGAHPGAGVDAAEQPAAAGGTPAAESPAESHAQQPAGGLSLGGQRCLDLSAGCGLVGEPRISKLPG
jgi:hypothetical protein